MGAIEKNNGKRYSQGLGKAFRWLGFAALALFGLLAVGLLTGFTAEKWIELRDKRLYPPPGRMTETGNGRRHMFCEGRGAPTVVQITGNGIPAVLIRPLQDRVAKYSHVCIYDRAGLGWSEPAIRPINIAGQADELHKILAANGERGPFIMTGHSYGGLIARQYLKDNPHTVAGIVLVDSGEEGEVFQAKALKGVAAAVSQSERSERLARFGLLRALVAIDPSAASYSPHLTDAERREANALILRPSFYHCVAVELTQGYDNTPPAMQKAGGFGTLGTLPLVVIRHGQPFAGSDAWREEGWQKAQVRLAALSSDSRLMTAARDGHNIIVDNPDLVSSAIHDVVTAVRERRKLN
ncbi:MAG: alpha/beta fold hydrolase [Alphaproteobacteria bacterium]|nr:alpha/beta fold hydrolase [Alphaproteobacteria bacterium]